MTVCSHVIVPIEQLSCEGFVVVVVGEVSHHLFKVSYAVDMEAVVM